MGQGGAQERRGFNVIEGGDLPLYPVATELRLTGHFFTRWEHDRWLYSELRLTASPAVRGVALDLFFLAQKQAPVGTLPDDDAQLAALLLLKPAEWAVLKGETPSPLHKWVRCQTDRGERRLMHPVVLEAVQATIGRRAEAAQARDADNERKRLAKLADMIPKAGGTQAMARDGALLEWADAWLRKNCRGYRTIDRVRQALEAHSDHVGAD